MYFHVLSFIVIFSHVLFFCGMLNHFFAFLNSLLFWEPTDLTPLFKSLSSTVSDSFPRSKAPDFTRAERNLHEEGIEIQLQVQPMGGDF